MNAILRDNLYNVGEQLLGERMACIAKSSNGGGDAATINDITAQAATPSKIASDRRRTIWGPEHLFLKHENSHLLEDVNDKHLHRN